VTATPGIALGVLAADCGPILFADAENRVIGAAHAGWKGALTGVLENTIDAMEKLGARRDAIVACLGPSISRQSYEVGPEFVERFVSQNEDIRQLFHCVDRSPGMRCSTFPHSPSTGCAPPAFARKASVSAPTPTASVSSPIGAPRTDKSRTTADRFLQLPSGRFERYGPALREPRIRRPPRAPDRQMQEEKLDAVLLFAQESMYWLTGYDTFGYCFFQTLVVKADGTMALHHPLGRSAPGTADLDPRQHSRLGRSRQRRPDGRSQEPAGRDGPARRPDRHRIRYARHDRPRCPPARCAADGLRPDRPMPPISSAACA
jgi:hypothetical protein